MSEVSQSISIQQALSKVMEGTHLSKEEARELMSGIMDGNATNAQIGAILAALRMKGETPQEIAGFAETMRTKAGLVQSEYSDMLDTCGTGGDGAETFNISTASAIVAAAGGIQVAKHGNRSASSKCGSADVLESLGVNIQLTSEQAARCLQEVGICFMFAQVYHRSMKYVAATRKELGVRTVFNLLGPLTNPAGAQNQLMGVYDRSKTELVARVLRELKVKRALVVASYDGLDEISISDATKVTELKDGEINTYDIKPEELGLSRYTLADIKGGDAEANAGILRRILSGEKGAARDIVLANAGACFYVTGRSESLLKGVNQAAELIDSGKALDKLNKFIEFTGEVAHVS